MTLIIVFMWSHPGLATGFSINHLIFISVTALCRRLSRHYWITLIDRRRNGGIWVKLSSPWVAFGPLVAGQVSGSTTNHEPCLGLTPPNTLFPRVSCLAQPLGLVTYKVCISGQRRRKQQSRRVMRRPLGNTPTSDVDGGKPVQEKGTNPRQSGSRDQVSKTSGNLGLANKMCSILPEQRGLDKKALWILTLHFDQFDGFNIIEIFHCFSRDEEI